MMNSFIIALAIAIVLLSYSVGIGVLEEKGKEALTGGIWTTVMVPAKAFHLVATALLSTSAAAIWGATPSSSMWPSAVIIIAKFVASIPWRIISAWLGDAALLVVITTLTLLGGIFFMEFGEKQWTLTDFNLGRHLGEGGFGTVFEAVEIATGKVVALKILDKRRLIGDGIMHKLWQEVDIQSTLCHHNILKLLGFFEDDDHAYIVLEFAPGGDLYHALRRERRFSERRASRFILGVVEALRYCHEEGVIHRDLKPENILLGEGEIIKLADFGVSIYCRSRPATICGTEGFMSPEMSKRLCYDERTDIWSLGVVAYKLIVGSSPTVFDGHIWWSTNLDITSEAQDFLGKLLQSEPGRRMPLSQVAAHPWMMMHCA